MRTQIEAEGITADIETRPQGAVHVALSNSSGRRLTAITLMPEAETRWLVVGTWHAGDPWPLAMARGACDLTFFNGGYPGGVWDEWIIADTAQQAGVLAIEKVAATKSPPSLPDQALSPSEMPWPGEQAGRPGLRRTG